jgi:dextranase
MQIAYGDLKARIDMVRNKTESLIVGAYMGESGIDYTVLAGKATNSVGKNVFASKPVVAAGGYHMSIAALNVFQSCLLPNSIP